MKKIIIVGDAKAGHYGIGAALKAIIEDKVECFILANDDVPDEIINEMILQQNIVDNPTITEIIQLPKIELLPKEKSNVEARI